MPIKRRNAMTIAELLITMLIFSIFLIVLFSSLNIVINAMETQDMIVSKLYTASKINFLFGILEDEFKWLGSFGKGLQHLESPFDDIFNPKGLTATQNGTDVTLQYQYAVIENFVLQKKDAINYEIVFRDATATEVDGEYFVILSDEQMIDTAKATIDGFSDFVISATDSTVTLSNIYNPESHPATKIYFVRIREGNAVIKVIDENGNTDNLEQLVRGTLYYDYEASEITLNIRKGFSEFNSTMTILDDVELFELSFYEGDWKTAEEVVDFSGITAIQATLAVNIPVSKSIEKRCLQDNSDMIKLTKNRIFWLPPDENLN